MNDPPQPNRRASPTPGSHTMPALVSSEAWGRLVEGSASSTPMHQRCGRVPRRPFRASGRGRRPADERLIVLQSAGQDPEVNDVAAGLGDDVDDLSDGWGIAVTGNATGAGLD